MTRYPRAVTTSPQAPPPGLTVDGYTLLTRIGEGGMGVVHLARRGDGPRVALKVLRPHIVGDDEIRARLAREVRTVHALGAHPDEDVAAAFAAVLARLPVYRTYLPVGLAVLEGALADAAAAEPGLADVLGDLRPELTDPDSPVARRFQQTSGMVMAKGVEDRSFYRLSLIHI